MKTLKYMVLAAGLVWMTSCVDMDTAPEGGTVTEKQKSEVVANDASRAEAGVNAIFAQLSQYAPTYDVIGSVRHNDFGYPSLMLMMDVNGYDVVGSNNGYNWFGNELTYSDRIYTSNEAKIIWGTLYQQIYATNSVAAAIDAETEDSLSQYFLAQALGSRAFNYWVLAQLYQFNYKGHESSPCVPLITEQNAAEVGVNGAPRATVAEVYEQIMKDLDKTIELMEKTSQRPADTRYVSKAVAYGLRARANLTMQNWSAAAADAQAAIDAFGGRPYTIAEAGDSKYMTAFWNAADAPIMWAVIVEIYDDVVQSGLLNWPSHLQTLCYGYAPAYSGGFQISKRLFDQIPDSDVRKSWWTDADNYSARLEANPSAASYYESNGCVPYTEVKFGPDQGVIGTSDNASDIPLMRVEEMYLIKAEGEAMSGNTSAAKETLQSFVRTYRNPAYSCAASDAAGIQEEIYLQRRIEFWGEGLSWFDIHRLGKNVDRRGAGYTDDAVIYNIPAGSNIMLYRIPQTEIQANPQLDEADNNPEDNIANYRVADTE